MNVRANDPRISRVVDTVAPLGWALHGGWPREEALRLLGVPTEKLDDAVTELWNDPDQTRLRNVGLKLGGYGRLRSTDFQRRFQLRSLLVLEAAATHLAGHYAAATALALAQIDGLTTDVTRSTFFHHEPDPTRPGYTDDITLAGIDGNLPVVRKAFSAPVDTTGRHGLISRHGILHGRDLTYATATTSTKTLVLLEALVERLARPADDKARRERRQSDQKAMKLTGFDDSGRLLVASMSTARYASAASSSDQSSSTGTVRFARRITDPSLSTSRARTIATSRVGRPAPKPSVMSASEEGWSLSFWRWAHRTTSSTSFAV